MLSRPATRRALIVGAPSALLVAVIRLYQLTLGRLLPSRCRFHPSCSMYAIDAVRSRGAIRGAMLAAGRLLRCGPWSAGGPDPAPTARENPAGRVEGLHAEAVVG